MSYNLHRLGWPTPQRVEEEPEPQPAPADPLPAPAPVFAGTVHKQDPALVPTWVFVAIAIGSAIVTPLLVLFSLHQISQLRTSLQIISHMNMPKSYS